MEKESHVLGSNEAGYELKVQNCGNFFYLFEFLVLLLPRSGSVVCFYIVRASVACEI